VSVIDLSCMTFIVSDINLIYKKLRMTSISFSKKTKPNYEINPINITSLDVVVVLRLRDIVYLIPLIGYVIVGQHGNINHVLFSLPS